MTEEHTVSRVGLDGLALKPAEHNLSRAFDLSVDIVNVDYEGRDRFPDREFLRELATETTVYATTPVRADGFDLLGDDSLLPLPDGVDRVLVAGNGAYLSKAERNRAIAPRLGAAREAAPDAWVGTDGVERLALAAGGTQYELLSRTTADDVRALRAAGFDGEIAIYAPFVLSNDDDAILDAVGDYTSRRGPVERALPDGGSTDGTATGRTREVLLQAVRDYALVGSIDLVADHVDALRDAGVDTVVGYPARGLDGFF